MAYKTQSQSRSHLKRMIQHPASKLEAIGVLASGIAHDFNNIMAAISGNCELALLQIDRNSPIRPYLKSIMAAGKKATGLIQQILTITRKTDDKQHPILIHIVLSEILKLLRPTIPATIEFKLDICRDTLYVLADVAQIYQLIVRLCTHAVQAMGNAGGTLTINLSQIHFDPSAVNHISDLKIGPYLQLDISNISKGKSPNTPEHRPHSDQLFQPETSDSESELTEVHKIIRLHKGAMTVYSPNGNGTTFSLCFPIINTGF
jgi:signal transduction histidine kinase